MGFKEEQVALEDGTNLVTCPALFELLAAHADHLHLVVEQLLVANDGQEVLQDLQNKLVVVTLELHLVAFHVKLILLNGTANVAALI